MVTQLSDAAYIAPIILSIAGFIFIIIVALVWYIYAMPRRTKGYREDLSNLYVAGRIRQIATEDKIDLNNEYDVYKTWVRKTKLENKSLDYSIEEELKEKLEQRNKKK